MLPEFKSCFKKGLVKCVYCFWAPVYKAQSGHRDGDISPYEIRLPDNSVL